MTIWEIPVTTLNAVSVANPYTTSASVDHGRVVDVHAIYANISSYAGGANVEVVLEGSLDGTNWYTLAYYANPGNGASLVQSAAPVPARYTRTTAGADNGSTTAVVTAVVVSGTTA